MHMSFRTGAVVVEEVVRDGVRDRPTNVFLTFSKSSQTSLRAPATSCLTHLPRTSCEVEPLTDSSQMLYKSARARQVLAGLSRHDHLVLDKLQTTAPHVASNGGFLLMFSGESEATAHQEGLLLHIRELVSPQQFNTWFRNVSLIPSDESSAVRLMVPNTFVRDWITNYYSNILGQAVRRCFGEDREVSLTTDPSAPPPPSVEAEVPPFPDRAETAAPEAQPHSVMARKAGAAREDVRLALYSDTVLHGDYTFDNFVIGSSNHFAHAAAIAVADAPGKSYNPFFLHGSVGLGKTHLLQAVCHQILAQQPGANILYLSSESFINQFIGALEDNDLSSFRHKYRNVDVLLVDDIHLLANKERTQEEFFHTFNTIYNLGHQIVLSSDAPPKEIPTLQERLVSRFKMGFVVEIAPPDFETRVNILKRKARLRGHELLDDVAHFLAEHVSTNIRELEGAVIRLIGYASLLDRAITLDLAREVIMDDIGPRKAAVTIQDIVSAVTRYFNVKLSELQSKRRNQSIAFPRQVCMYLARAKTNLSLEEIGGYFGGRDHTTVIYATDKIKKVIAADQRQNDLIQHLLREIS